MKKIRLFALVFSALLSSNMIWPKIKYIIVLIDLQ